MKKDNPAGYEKVLKGESTWRKEYDNVIKEDKEVNVEKPLVDPTSKNETMLPKEKPKILDIREKINTDTQSVPPDVRKAIKHETSANALISALEEIVSIHDEEVEDFSLFDKFLSTLNHAVLIEAKDRIEDFIRIGGYKK